MFNSYVSADVLLPAFMYKSPAMTKSFVNNLGEEWLRARRANPNFSTLGLLSEEEQRAGAVAAKEEEEEEPFIALVKKPNLTEASPFSDFFGTFVQVPLVPVPISLERGKAPITPTHIISNPALRMMRPGLLIPSSSIISAPPASASELAVIPPVSSASLALALPPLASRPRAKRTPCRRSSPKCQSFNR